MLHCRCSIFVPVPIPDSNIILFPFQINFFDDHTKVILCPMMGAVTYIDENKSFRTFRFSLLEEFGCSEELATRLLYSKTMVERLLTSRTVGPTSSAVKAKVGQASAAATPAAPAR